MNFFPNAAADFLKHEYFVQGVLDPTAESDEYWKRWLQNNPDKIELFSAAKDLLLSFRRGQEHRMPEDAYFRILDNLLEENNKQKRIIPQRFPGNPKVWLSAASFVLFSFVFFTLLKVNKKEEKQRPVEYVTKYVPTGAKLTTILPDGSAVKLNSMSELKYPTVFSDTLREVFLTGEAFFEVKKDPKVPFIVHTKNFTTRVLGTSFDVRSYESEKDRYVAVFSGKVEVMASNGQEHLLSSNEMTTYNLEKNSVKKSIFNPATILSWRDGIIVFDHANFEDMTQYLSRWYGVDFVVEKGFKVRGSYSGTFNNETLENLLDGVSYSSHFKVRIVGQKVYISSSKH